MDKKYLIYSNFSKDIHSDMNYALAKEAASYCYKDEEIDDDFLDEWVKNANASEWEGMEKHFNELKRKLVVWKVYTEGGKEKYAASCDDRSFSNVFAANWMAARDDSDIEHYPFRIYDDEKNFAIESAVDNEDKTILVAEGRLMTLKGVKKPNDLSQETLKAIYKNCSVPINFSKELGIEWINDKGGK